MPLLVSQPPSRGVGRWAMRMIPMDFGSYKGLAESVKSGKQIKSLFVVFLIEFVVFSVAQQMGKQK